MQKAREPLQTLAYKPTLDEVLPRLEFLYSRRAGDRILARMEVPSRALAQFAAEYQDGYCDYPDPADRIAIWDRLLAERAELEDDSVPSAYLSEFDQGLYGALFGGHVQFMAHPENGWISSMVPPLLKDWGEFERLHFDRNHPWFDRYRYQLEAFVAGADAKFGISHFILIDGLNFVYELVGATETYISLVERPELVGRAIELAFELNVAVHEEFFARVPSLQGGTCSNMAEWLPGRVVSERVDPFHMTSVEYFERWGREPVERILGHFDGGVLHIHGNGRHLLEAVATIKGLKAIYLGDDRGYPAAIEVLADLQRRTADVPLVVSVPYGQFVERLSRHELPGGVLYKVTDVPDCTTANRLMEKVRSYRL